MGPVLGSTVPILSASLGGLLSLDLRLLLVRPLLGG